MLRDEEKFIEYLNANSLKQTTERIDIAKAVTSFDDIFTVDELMDMIREKGWPVSKATLYRSIPLLIESGMIKPIATHQLNNHTFKRRDENEPDSDFDCEACGISIKVNDEVVNVINQKLNEKYDPLEIVENLLMLKGICPKCVNDYKSTKRGFDNIHDLSKIRILLFEDEDMVRTLIRDFLEERGYEIFAFNDPSDFNLECKCNNDPNIICADILIVDIKMPGMTGVEFVEEQMAKDCRIKNVAFISANWTLEDLNFAGAIGAAIFHKPFNILELREWIDECVSNCHLDRSLGMEFSK